MVSVTNDENLSIIKEAKPSINKPTLIDLVIVEGILIIGHNWQNYISRDYKDSFTLL